MQGCCNWFYLYLASRKVEHPNQNRQASSSLSTGTARPPGLQLAHTVNNEIEMGASIEQTSMAWNAIVLVLRAEENHILQRYL